MNTIQIAKRVTTLIATEIKEVIQIGMRSGLNNLGDENIEKYPLTSRQMNTSRMGSS